MSSIDLHIHSNASIDGDLTPSAIVHMAKGSNLQAIAITDHNSVRGVRPGLIAAKLEGIKLIPGIEVDCLFGDLNLHVLGYNIDIEDPAFEEIEKGAIRQEEEYFPRLVDRLQELGFHVNPEDVIEFASTPVPCEEDVGAYLIHSEENQTDLRLQSYSEGGIRSDNPYFNFYLDFCTYGKPAFIERQYPDLSTVAQIIKDTGGIPVLAHPGESLPDPDNQIPSIVNDGILGIEVYSSYHSPQMTRYFKQKADEIDLIITCGSDFHGKNKPAITLGSVECEGYESQILQGLQKTSASE